jgi:NADH-quinone oxidoreductase subunit F
VAAAQPHGLFATAPQLGWQSHDTQADQPSGPVSNPILVNNVETLFNIPHILAHRADWFRSMGTINRQARS